MVCFCLRLQAGSRFTGECGIQRCNHVTQGVVKHAASLWGATQDRVHTTEVCDVSPHSVAADVGTSALRGSPCPGPELVALENAPLRAADAEVVQLLDGRLMALLSQADAPHDAVPSWGDAPAEEEHVAQEKALGGEHDVAHGHVERVDATLQGRAGPRKRREHALHAPQFRVNVRVNVRVRVGVRVAVKVSVRVTCTCRRFTAALIAAPTACIPPLPF